MREMKPCGTSAAYKRHYLNGEEPCGPCREAQSQESKLRYRKRHRVVKIPEVVVDVLVTHDRWMTTEVLVDWVRSLHPEWKAPSVERAIWRLKADGLIECRVQEHTYTDTFSRPPNKPNRMRTYRIAEWRADESAWEALDVVA